MRNRSLLFVLLLFVACNGGSPTEPRPLGIASGRWSGNAACLIVPAENVSPRTAVLTYSCARGEFRVPDLRSDGTFDVDGTFAVEGTPNPAPAHFSGVLTQWTLTLKVAPTDPNAPAATFHMNPNSMGGVCNPPCN